MMGNGFDFRILAVLLLELQAIGLPINAGIPLAKPIKAKDDVVLVDINNSSRQGVVEGSNRVRECNSFIAVYCLTIGQLDALHDNVAP